MHIEVYGMAVQACMSCGAVIGDSTAANCPQCGAPVLPSRGVFEDPIDVAILLITLFISYPIAVWIAGGTIYVLGWLLWGGFAGMIVVSLVRKLRKR
jgi:hypothetical protein